MFSPARFRALCLLLAVVPLLTACTTTYGSRTVPKARFDYNQAIVRSWDEQLLLNLVRLRYRDTPMFLELNSVVAGYTYSGSADAAALINVFGVKDVNEYDASTGLSYTERPTITYTPLSGEEFVSRLLSPISTETLLLLTQSGWSIERLLQCCVQRINELPNAPSAAGPTPSYVPRFREFHEVSELMRRLQIAGKVSAHHREDGIWVSIEGAENAEGDLATLRDLLGLESGKTEFRLKPQRWRSADDEIALEGRSLLGVLYYLSQSVEAPDDHEAEGLVTVTHDQAGNRFDWAALTRPLLRIRSTREQPKSASVAVSYRGFWFYIDDTDLNSKTTFGLLNFLFSLQAAGSKGGSPLLTISTGQ